MTKLSVRKMNKYASVVKILIQNLHVKRHFYCWITALALHDSVGIAAANFASWSEDVAT
jgi:hypothetical protein